MRHVRRIHGRRGLAVLRRRSFQPPPYPRTFELRGYTLASFQLGPIERFQPLIVAECTFIERGDSISSDCALGRSAAEGRIVHGSGVLLQQQLRMRRKAGIAHLRASFGSAESWSPVTSERTFRERVVGPKRPVDSPLLVIQWFWAGPAVSRIACFRAGRRRAGHVL